LFQFKAPEQAFLSLKPQANGKGSSKETLDDSCGKRPLRRHDRGSIENACMQATAAKDVPPRHKET
jgi:hypothetical protein